MVKKTIKKVLALPGTVHARAFVSKLKDGDYSVGEVPYQCQFATPELAKDILEGNIDAKNDPKWQDFGFGKKEQYEYWVFRACGVCCIKMAIDFNGHSGTVAELVNEGIKIGGYNIEKDDGWYYKPLLKLASNYGLNGYVASYLSKYELAKQLIGGRMVIASVSPTIIRMDKNIQSKQKNGHLVLVIGLRINNNKLDGFYINNPSGKTPKMRKNAYIPIKTFTDAYGSRGIVLS